MIRRVAAFACQVSVPAAIALLWSPVTLAADSGLPELMPDGWHSWQVAATTDAPVGCCYQRYGDFVSPVVCQLGKSMSFVGNADEMRADEVAIYARFEKGQIQSVRALAPDCPVEAPARINPHGVVRNDDSVIRLAHAIAPRSDVSAEVIAAISFHAGAEARRTLEATAIGGAELANRKDAIFWIGQSRAAEMRTLLRRLMFNDANPEIRQHTAFAWSQSKLPDVAAELVELGRNDPHSGVRGQAWFWLAQTGSASAEDAITRAIDNESEPEVREQAIFALSQLPAQRGVDALIGLLQDRSLPRNHRKQAMFWLAQSESSDAMEYLGDILSR